MPKDIKDLVGDIKELTIESSSLLISLNQFFVDNTWNKSSEGQKIRAKADILQKNLMKIDRLCEKLFKIS